MEATLEHPFFVFGQGWSSCEPDRSLHRYGLDCQKLSVGDVCISLTHKDVQERAAEISQQQQQELKDSPHRSSLRNSTSMLSPAHKRSSPNDPEGRPRKHHLSSMSSPKDNVEIKQENPHYSVTWYSTLYSNKLYLCYYFFVLLLQSKIIICYTLHCFCMYNSNLMRLLILSYIFQFKTPRQRYIVWYAIFWFTLVYM